jgi:hypothetical protein
VQRRATKMVNSIAHLTYPERLKILKLTTLYYRRLRNDMLQVYRIIHNIDKSNFGSFFQYNTTVTRGHRLKLYKMRSKTTTRQHSFAQRSVNLWNDLSEPTVTAGSINNFKSGLEKDWMDKSFKYDMIYN